MPKDWNIHGSTARDRIVQSSHGEANPMITKPEPPPPSTRLETLGRPWRSKGCQKETNVALSPGLDCPGDTGRSDTGMDHPRKQSLGLQHPGQPCRSKDGEEVDRRRLAPWIGASRVHGEKRPRMGSCRGERPRTGTSKAAMANWLPHPCRIGEPHRCRAGAKIRSGPQVGEMATSPLPYRGAPPLQSGGPNQKWPTSG